MLTWRVISSCSSLEKAAKWSYFVPIRNGMAVFCENETMNLRYMCIGVSEWSRYAHTLLKPRACRYHSLIEFKVDFLLRSNMNSMATASLHTSGNMFTNSRCPPRSQIEKVISVFRIEMVFSIKLTPFCCCCCCCCIQSQRSGGSVCSCLSRNLDERKTDRAFVCNPHRNFLPHIWPSN
jgi:hypothetical protein